MISVERARTAAAASLLLRNTSGYITKHPPLSRNGHGFLEYNPHSTTRCPFPHTIGGTICVMVRITNATCPDKLWALWFTAEDFPSVQQLQDRLRNGLPTPRQGGAWLPGKHRGSRVLGVLKNQMVFSGLRVCVGRDSALMPDSSGAVWNRCSVGRKRCPPSALRVDWTRQSPAGNKPPRRLS